jgi:hypothetical protein
VFCCFCCCRWCCSLSTGTETAICAGALNFWAFQCGNRNHHVGCAHRR